MNDIPRGDNHDDAGDDGDDDNHNRYHSTDLKGLPSTNVLGCTIDARIVCIVTNTLFGGIALFGLIMILFDPDFFQNYSPYNIFFKLQGWTSIVVPIINVVFAVLGLVGALRYQSCLVFTVFLWFMFEMVSSVILGLWSGVSMAFVFGLPNANLFCQLKTLESQSTIE